MAVFLIWSFFIFKIFITIGYFNNGMFFNKDYECWRSDKIEKLFKDKNSLVEKATRIKISQICEGFKSYKHFLMHTSSTCKNIISSLWFGKNTSVNGHI